MKNALFILCCSLVFLGGFHEDLHGYNRDELKAIEIVSSFYGSCIENDLHSVQDMIHFESALWYESEDRDHFMSKVVSGVVDFVQTWSKTVDGAVVAKSYWLSDTDRDGHFESNVKFQATIAQMDHWLSFSLVRCRDSNGFKILGVSSGSDRISPSPEDIMQNALEDFEKSQGNEAVEGSG